MNGYLTKPTTRLARYPLLLEAILKQTPDDHPDKEALPEVVKQVRAFLKAVNTESGKSENMFNLAQLDQQLIFRPGENIVIVDAGASNFIADRACLLYRIYTFATKTESWYTEVL